MTDYLKNLRNLNDERDALKSCREPLAIQEELATLPDVQAAIFHNSQIEKAKGVLQSKEDRYEQMSLSIQAMEDELEALMAQAPWALNGLVVHEGEVYLNGIAWDGISGSERLAIAYEVAKLENPNCGLVILDDAERFDRNHLATFRERVAKDGMVMLELLVDRSEDATLIIEDGTVGDLPLEEEEVPAEPEPKEEPKAAPKADVPPPPPPPPPTFPSGPTAKGEIPPAGDGTPSI